MISILLYQKQIEKLFDGDHLGDRWSEERETVAWPNWGADKRPWTQFYHITKIMTLILCCNDQEFLNLFA